MSEQKMWQEKFSQISPWFSDIIADIKKDCKNEHLRLDPQFVRQHFGGMPIHRITIEQMRDVYFRQILAGHVRLAEFIVNRWLFRNMEIYRFFETALKKIDLEFEKLESLPLTESRTLLAEALKTFQCEKLFCFVVLNDVAFPESLLEELQKRALDSLSIRQENHEEDRIEKKLREEMVRMKERHEKKVQELTKRHQGELEQLRREVAKLRQEKQEALQRVSS